MYMYVWAVKVVFVLLRTVQVEYKSTNMEVVGLKRALNFLKDKVKISEVVTDASTTVISCLGTCITLYNITHTNLHLQLIMFAYTAANEFPEYYHSLDVWHKAKKLKKSLSEVSFMKVWCTCILNLSSNRLPKAMVWGYWTCGQAKSSTTSGGPAGHVMTT